MSPARPDAFPPDDVAADGARKSRLTEFFVDRLGLDQLWPLAAKKRVPIHGMTECYFLGGMALFLFAIQVVTGTLLSLYYKPSPDQAFESVRAIMTEVDFGWLIRSIHSWSANLLIGVLFLHVLTTYMMRAYQRPREFTWMTWCCWLPLRRPIRYEASIEGSLAEIEKRHIAAVLEHTQDNITRAAEILRVDRVAVCNKIKKYGLRP